MPKVEQVGRAAEGAVMTEGCGMWPVQTGLRMTKGGRGADYQSISDVVLFSTGFWFYICRIYSKVYR